MQLFRLLPERFSHAVTVLTILVSLSAACSGQTNRFEAGISAKERGQYLTAIRSWLPLAEDGMPEAQVNLGHMYNEGLGVDVDYEEALAIVGKLVFAVPRVQEAVGALVSWRAAQMYRFDLNCM